MITETKKRGEQFFRPWIYRPIRCYPYGGLLHRRDDIRHCQQL